MLLPLGGSLIQDFDELYQRSRGDLPSHLYRLRGGLPTSLRNTSRPQNEGSTGNQDITSVPLRRTYIPRPSFGGAASSMVKWTGPFHPLEWRCCYGRGSLMPREPNLFLILFLQFSYTRLQPCRVVEMMTSTKGLMPSPILDQRSIITDLVHGS